MLHRLGTGLAAVLLIFCICLQFSPASAQAQEGDQQDDGDEKQGKATKGEKAGEKPEKSYLRWMIESSGPIGAVLFAMSFITIALSIMCMISLRHNEVVPPDLISEFEAKLNEKQYQEAYDLARNDESFMGKVLAAGLGRLSSGYDQALQAMEETAEDESMKIEHRLSWLAILGTTSPLLGLLGTVEGIIASFRVIATSDTQPKPSLLAEGISTSLFNTFEGLFVAIIATTAFMIFKNKAVRLALDVSLTAGNLMSRFATVPGRPRDQSGTVHTS